jgi:O-succinylbenzoate synthase
MNTTIDAVTLRHVRMRLKSPFVTSFGVELDRDCLIIELESQGISGWGECVAGSFPGYSYETADTAWHVLSEFFIPALLKSEIAAPAELTDRLAEYKGHPLAKAGLELALWDLFGRLSKRSLAEMLGVRRDRVPVGVSVGIQPTTPQLVETVRGYVGQGYPRVKLKIRPGRDIDDVAAVHAAFPWLPLQVDANSAYTIGDLSIFMAMDDFGLLLIEQPLAEDDLLDHGLLQSRLRTPVCLDESILSLRHARQALEIDACRVINIKQARVGGLTEAIAIHNLCFGYGIPVWCGGMLETGIGRAANLALAGLPGFQLPGDISASDRYYDRDVAEPTFSLNPDGTIDVPTGIGLGVEVDRRALRAVTLREEILKP